MFGKRAWPFGHEIFSKLFKHLLMGLYLMIGVITLFRVFKKNCWGLVLGCSWGAYKDHNMGGGSFADI
jgi:hypothetical protein